MLTSKQSQIADLLLVSASRSDIATRLRITRSEVGAAISEMRQLLGVDTPAGLTARLREVTRNPVEATLARCREQPRQWWMT
jgi:DNA-binding NarL/FixJ family response regulator